MCISYVIFCSAIDGHCSAHRVICINTIYFAVARYRSVALCLAYLILIAVHRASCLLTYRKGDIFQIVK